MPEPSGILVGAGRPLIFSLAEPSPNANDSNLWEVKLDPRTGKLEDKPARITNWAGFSFASPTAPRTEAAGVSEIQFSIECLRRRTEGGRKQADDAAAIDA